MTSSLSRPYRSLALSSERRSLPAWLSVMVLDHRSKPDVMVSR